MGLLGKDAQPHGLCPDLLPLPFLPLHASSLQVATQQRKKGADERPFFSLSCRTFYCPELNQIPVSHMDKREREHAEHNPTTLSRHLLPASSYPVPGLWQWLLMLWEILWGEKKPAWEERRKASSRDCPQLTKMLRAEHRLQRALELHGQADTDRR